MSLRSIPVSLPRCSSISPSLQLDSARTMALRCPKLLVGVLLATATFIQPTDAVYGHGLRGLGLHQVDDFVCASICRTCFASSALNCSTIKSGKATSTPQCYVNDYAFSTSLAYCISTHCYTNITLGRIEDYWRNLMPGTANGKAVLANTTYSETLKNVTTRPTVKNKFGTPLNKTSLVDEDKYTAYYRQMMRNQDVEQHSSYFA